MGTWMNSDGLFVKLGVDEGTVGKAGEFAEGSAGAHVIEINLPDLTALGTAAAIFDDNCIVPSGYRLIRAQLITKTAVTSGGSAVLNVGLIRRDRTTEIDYDGIFAAVPIANFNAAGETVDLTQGVATAGALFGTELANSGYLTADYDTAAFTAGAIKIKVWFQKF